MELAILISFLGSWLAFAFFGFRKQWSGTISVGGGFFVGCLSVALMTTFVDFSKRPDSQERFMSLVVSYSDQAKRAAGNHVRLEQLRKERAAILAREFSTNAVQNWVGTVKGIGSTFVGDASVEISLSRNITISTWTVALADIGDKTLVEKNSALFKKLPNFQIGQRVYFDGEFLANDKDGVREKSLRIRDSMESPSFVFRFSDIRAAR